MKRVLQRPHWSHLGARAPHQGAEVTSLLRQGCKVEHHPTKISGGVLDWY
jgi:hypothetical protein